MLTASLCFTAFVLGRSLAASLPWKSAQCTEKGTIVLQLIEGPIRGRSIDCGNDTSQLYHGSAFVFQGIPYAQPPIQKLRFKKPNRVDRWADTLNTTNWGSACPQIYPTPIPQNEDCLYLNIFTKTLFRQPQVRFLRLTSPSTMTEALHRNQLQMQKIGTSPGLDPLTSGLESATPVAALSRSTCGLVVTKINPTSPSPVMVFIHGGSFTSGETATYGLEGIITQFVNRDVVVVTIQYRLGLLGLFTTKNDVFPANLALWDQVEALRFVQRNIGRFGGDPHRVTVFGESAGACSVSMLTYSPVVKDESLFQQAIMQSGAVLTCMSGSLTDYQQLAYSKNAAMLLCNVTEQQWDTGAFVELERCLRAKSWQEIIKLQQMVPRWAPVVDGTGGIFPEVPEKLAPHRPLMPVLAGTNRDESADINALVTNKLGNFTNDLLESIINTSITEEVIGPKYAQVRQVLLATYRDSIYPPLAPDDHIGWLKTLTKMLSDIYFNAPTQKEVELWLRSTGKDITYLYTFDYEGHATFTPNSHFQPVAHAYELPYLFRLNLTAINNRTYSAEDLAVSSQMADLWTTFAKYGDPTPPDVHPPTKWLSLDYKSTSRHLSISENPQMIPEYYPKRMSTWNQVIPAIVKSERLVKNSIEQIKRTVEKLMKDN